MFITIVKLGLQTLVILPVYALKIVVSPQMRVVPEQTVGIPSSEYLS